MRTQTPLGSNTTTLAVLCMITLEVAQGTGIPPDIEMPSLEKKIGWHLCYFRLSSLGLHHSVDSKVTEFGIRVVKIKKPSIGDPGMKKVSLNICSVLPLPRNNHNQLPRFQSVKGKDFKVSRDSSCYPQPQTQTIEKTTSCPGLHFC